jgi:hypothetical protein
VRFATLLLAAALASCATAGKGPDCNAVIEQCNPADYPPLIAQLPPWPFPRLFKPLPEAPK